MIMVSVFVPSQLRFLSDIMGKKSRVKIQKSGSGASAVVSPKEMMNLISELLLSKFTFNLLEKYLKY